MIMLPPDLYFMKGKKEASREEMEKVMKYVIDGAKKDIYSL